MTLSTRARAIAGVDPDLLALLQDISASVDMLTTNFRAGSSEPKLRAGQYGGSDVADVVNIPARIIDVKALRFINDKHNLILESAESMGVRVNKTTPTVLAVGITTALAFDGEDWDIDEMHSNVTNNTRLTIRHQGKYIIGGEIEFEPDGAGAREILVRKNGATVLVQDSRLTVGAVVSTFCSVVTADHFVIDDYVELCGINRSGVGVNVNTANFWAHRVS